MANSLKEELRREHHIAQIDALVRQGEGVMQEFTFVSKDDLAELRQSGQRLASEGEPAQLLYLDDTRCVRVCAIAEAAAGMTAPSEGRRRGHSQNSAPATTQQRQISVFPAPARA